MIILIFELQWTLESLLGENYSIGKIRRTFDLTTIHGLKDKQNGI